MTRSFSYAFRFLFLGLFLTASATGVMAQARLILNNGGFVNIAQGASLVIENPAANAITRNTSGHIISEGENNTIKWMIGTTAASYTIPFGLGTANYIPVSFTTASASGSGFFKFSTYRTTWDNSSMLPTGVNTLSNGSGTDNSAFVLDRFWQIDAQSYTTKPTLTNLLFTYIDVEHSVASNTITESNLKAQRYNSNTNDWGGYTPAGTVSTAGNTVTITSVAVADLYKWWTLVDLSSPLPIELLSFSATPDEQSVKLDWTTAIEINNDYFTIQRSRDGLAFSDIAKVPAGTAGKIIQKYTYVDSDPLSGKSYYRLKQTDLDGAYEFSDIRMVELEESQARITAYPNPVTDNKFSIDFHHALETPTVVVVYDRMGRIIFSEIVNPGERTYTVNLNNPSTGVYVLKTTNAKSSFQQTIVVK